jgi:hypothetical protein
VSKLTIGMLFGDRKMRVYLLIIVVFLARSGFGQLSSRIDPMTDNGLLGSGWAFQRILSDAGYRPIGVDPLSTMSIYQALASGADGARPVSAPIPGGVTIIISPTNENGAGCVGFVRDGSVLCNSGRTGQFVPTFSLQQWIDRFGVRFGYYFFVLSEPSSVLAKRESY